MTSRRPSDMPDDPEARIRRYEERLNDGYELIDKRRAAGVDVTKLEDFWCQLLKEYEKECDENEVKNDKPWRKPV